MNPIGLRHISFTVLYILLVLGYPGYGLAGIPGDMDADNDVDGSDLAAYSHGLAIGVPTLPVVEFVGQYCAIITDPDEMALTSGWTPPSLSTITPPSLRFSWTTGPPETASYEIFVGTFFDRDAYHHSTHYQGGHTYQIDNIEIDDTPIMENFVRVTVYYLDDEDNRLGSTTRLFYRPRITAPGGSVLHSSSITVQWDPGNDYSYANVRVGIDGPFLNPGKYCFVKSIQGTQLICDEIPVDGSEIRVQVQMYNDEGLFRDTIKYYTAYTWTKDDFAMVPGEGSVLLGSEALFDWEDIPHVEQYGIRIGTGAPGNNDIQTNTALGTTSFFQSTSIPQDGSVVYVRLFYQFEGTENACILFVNCPYVDFVYQANDLSDIIPIRCAFQGEPDYVSNPSEPEIYQPGNFCITCWVSLMHLWRYEHDPSISVCDVQAALYLDLLEEMDPNDPDTMDQVKFYRDYGDYDKADGSCPLDDPFLAVRLTLPPDDRATNLLPFDLYPYNGIEGFYTGKLEEPYVNVYGEDPTDELADKVPDIWVSMLDGQIPVMHEFDRAVNYGSDATDYTIKVITDIHEYNLYDYIVYKFPVNSAVLKAGQWRYTLIVDPDRVVDEHSETNNELQGNFSVYHFPSPPPDSADELPSAQEPVCTANGSTDLVHGYKVDACNGAYWDSGLKISPDWDYWVGETWTDCNGSNWGSTINESEMAMMVMAEFWGPRGSGVIERNSVIDEPFYDGDAGCSGCENPRPRPDAIQNIIWFSAGQASCRDYARITGQPEGCEPPYDEEKMPVDLQGGIKSVPAQIALKEDVYPEYERNNTLMVMAFDNEYDKIADTREDCRSIEDGWLRYFQERTDDFAIVTHIWLGGMSRGAVLGIQLAKRIQEMKKCRSDMRDITVVVTANDPVTDPKEWRYETQCTDDCDNSAGGRFDVWSHWYLEHRTGRYDYLFDTSDARNPYAWSGMQDDFWLRILAGDGAQMGHGRTGACAQVFSGQKEIADGEGKFQWNWDEERWDAYSETYSGIPFLTQRWKARSHEWIRHHFGDGTQALMEYAYLKLWGYGESGTDRFEIVNPNEDDPVVADECTYGLITAQNLTTGTIPFKDAAGYTTHHAQTFIPNRTLIPRVVYIPLSYDSTEDIAVSIKTVDRRFPDNPLAGETIFSAQDNTTGANYEWYRFEDKTVYDTLSTHQTYWLIITPLGTPAPTRYGEIGVADLPIPVADVYLGGHRSHYYGGWTHYRDQNDLVFKIYGEDMAP